jgi:hypothetical protein
MPWGTATGSLGNLASGLAHKNPEGIFRPPGWIDIFAVSNPTGGLFGPRELEHWVFKMDPANARSWTSARVWSGPRSLGGRLRDLSPSVAAWSEDRLDVFAIGADELDGTVQHWWYERGLWGGPETLAGEHGLLASAGPSVASWGPNRLDVFAVRNPDGWFGPRTLQHWWWDGSQWSGPESRGGRLWDVSPCAVSRSAGRLDVLAVADSGQLVHWEWDGGSWHDAAPRGGSLANGAGPCAVSWGGDRLDVFAIGHDQTLQHWWVNGPEWNGPETLGGTVEISTPSAGSRGPGLVDVFATRLVDYVFGPRHVQWWQYDESGWAQPGRLLDWTSIAGPVAVARPRNRIDLFAVHDSNIFSGPANQLQWAWFDPDYSPPAIAITSAARLPDAFVSVPYRFQFSAAGGSGRYWWSADGLPTGLAVDAQSGIVSGQPTTPTYSNDPGHFTVRVHDDSYPMNAWAPQQDAAILVRQGAGPPPTPPTPTTGYAHVAIWNCTDERYSVHI